MVKANILPAAMSARTSARNELNRSTYAKTNSMDVHSAEILVLGLIQGSW